MSVDWAAVTQGGVSVPPLRRVIDQASMVAYAGATWDWHRLHYDAEFARTLGFSGTVVDGQVFGALMAECLQDWLGPRAWISTLSFRFKTPVISGSTVRCEGETVSLDDDAIHVNLKIVVLDNADEVTATAAVGEAKVVRR